MALLAGVAYDPATSVAKATSSLLAMTAFDTTNARVTFTAPSSGNVLVRLKTVQIGAATNAQCLFGVLSGSTVLGRAAPIAGCSGGAAAHRYSLELLCVVTGLSGSQTWDAAYAVQVIVASTTLNYGGPNDTTGQNAWGALIFEVWDAPHLLAATLYDPGTAASVSTTTLQAMTALDTTNLRLTFTAPASGNVLVRVRVTGGGATTQGMILLGALESSTVVGRVAPLGGKTQEGTLAATDFLVYDAQFLVTGLTPGSSHTYDAAYGVEVVAGTGGVLKWGGPNNATGANAWGGAAFEIWAA